LLFFLPSDETFIVDDVDLKGKGNHGDSSEFIDYLQNGVSSG